MKRWISASCVALLCGAAFAQTCDKSAKAECPVTAAAASLVKADSDSASACTQSSNWLSVAFHRAKKAPESKGIFFVSAKADTCDSVKTCSESKATTVAAQTKQSCCSDGQSTAAALIAASAKADSCTAAKTGCSETAPVATIAVAGKADSCTAAKTGCGETAPVATIAVAGKADSCTAAKTGCSETAPVATIAVAGKADTCTAAKSDCSETAAVTTIAAKADKASCASSCTETVVTTVATGAKADCSAKSACTETIAVNTVAGEGETCSSQSTCTESTTVTAVAQEQACSSTKTCTETGVAIIAASVNDDKACSSTCTESATVTAVAQEQACSSTKTCPETGVAVIAASAKDDKTCSSTCTESATVTAVAQEQACSSTKTCTETGVAVIAASAKDDKTCSSTCSESATVTAVAQEQACSSTKTCPETGVAVIAASAKDDKTCSSSCSESATVTTVAGPANKTCPISGKPVMKNAVATYKGNEIAFCNSMCANYFDKADEAKKDKVYQTIAASFQPAKSECTGDCEGEGACAACKASAQTVAMKTGAKSDPYTLNVCAVSGGKLGSMGEPVVKTVEGREIKFCCSGCVAPYEANPAKYNAKLDVMLAKQQMAYYPEQKCAIAGTELIRDGKDMGKNVIVHNRLVRVCCGDCAAKVKADPAAVFKKLDKQIIAKQAEHYPMESCMIMTSRSLGETPTQIVSGNRLVQFCCKGCVGAYHKDPAAHIAKLDKAWAEKYPKKFKTAKVETAGG